MIYLFAVYEIFISNLNIFMYSEKVANFVVKLALNAIYNNLNKSLTKKDQNKDYYVYYFSQCRPNSKLAFHLKLLCQLERSKSKSNWQSKSTQERSINNCEEQMANRREKREGR